MSIDNDDLTDLRDGLATIACQQRAADTLERATKYAHDIVTWLHRDHYADNAKFEPFDDLLGLLSQIDNMICGWKEPPAAVADGACQHCGGCGVVVGGGLEADIHECSCATQRGKGMNKRTWEIPAPVAPAAVTDYNVDLVSGDDGYVEIVITPAPVAQKVPRELTRAEVRVGNYSAEYADGWNDCRNAMLAKVEGCANVQC